MLQDLMHDNEKWIKFNDELKRLETLFKDISSIFDSKTFVEKSLEEKQQILQVNESSMDEFLGTSFYAIFC
jgi:hypothetical protein